MTFNDFDKINECIALMSKKKYKLDIKNYNTSYNFNLNFIDFFNKLKKIIFND